MPLPLLFALFLAFGLDVPPPGQRDPADLASLGGLSLLLIGLIAVAAWGLGRWAAAAAARDHGPSAALRRRFGWGARGIEWSTLAAYAAIIHRFDWPYVVRAGLGSCDLTVVVDALILLPFVAMQIAGWWGIFPAERALRPDAVRGRAVGRLRHVALRARQSLGLVLPMLVLYAVGQDVVRRLWPQLKSSPWLEPVEAVAMGALVVLGAPIFLRLAWPTRRLPDGPLRDRLESLARRLGFRCSDILVWDTGRNMVNACVTGLLPSFRYVLLTDALIDHLHEHEIAAVFGHEIGHIAHRHLFYLGFFFAASLGIMALLGDRVDASLALVSARFLRQGHPWLEALVESSALVAAAGAYVLIVLGFVSRRFERQADVFACQAVSCGQADCPPHLDLDEADAPGPVPQAPCPVGVRIFANALINVAELNGMEPGARSWRHGSIARRIAFLEGLEGRPDALVRFHAGVSRLRVALTVCLAAAIVAALAAGPAGFLD